MEYLIIVLLVIIIFTLSTKYFLLKKQMKAVIKQLDAEKPGLVTTQLVDKDFSEVVWRINRLLEEIQQTIIRERKASAALKASIVNISHDMKTPLTSVIGYLQLAGKECGSSQTKEMIQICLERARYCNSLINHFFELSMLEANGCEPNMEKVDVAAELCEEILSCIPQLDERGIVPCFEHSDRAVFAEADRLMLRRLIQNLLSNAIRYADGDVTFFVTEGEDIKVTISNPVKEELAVEHMFDRLYTQDKARSGGTGIGLYLCKEFAEAMGGSIFAELRDGSLSITLCLKRFGS